MMDPLTNSLIDIDQTEVVFCIGPNYEHIILIVDKKWAIDQIRSMYDCVRELWNAITNMPLNTYYDKSVCVITV